MTSVTQLKNSNGDPVNSQFIILTDKGRYFQSYETIVAFFPADGTTPTLDKNALNYSKTTSKYLFKILGEDRKTIERRIKEGSYILADLNGGIGLA